MLASDDCYIKIYTATFQLLTRFGVVQASHYNSFEDLAAVNWLKWFGTKTVASAMVAILHALLGAHLNITTTQR